MIWIQERLNNNLASNIEMLRVVEKIQRTGYILTQRKGCSKDQQTRYNCLSHGLLPQYTDLLTNVTGTALRNIFHRLVDSRRPYTTYSIQKGHPLNNRGQTNNFK